MSNIPAQIDDLHIRIGQLEKRLVEEPDTKDKIHPAIGITVSLIALVFAYFGFELPNHLYQYVFSAILLLVLYNKKTICTSRNWHQWIFVAANLLTAAMVLKLLIGGGDPKPFSWAQLPVIQGGITDFSISWQKISASDFSLPLTVIQSYLLTLLLFGYLAGLRLFSSLLGLVLVFLSIPSLIDFDWNWVLPALIMFGISLYAQRNS